MKTLFLLKRREDYNSVVHNTVGLSTGLYNSASFMNEMLVQAGVESHLEVVTDNNCIDGQVNKYKPTHVIIEALWVVPSKIALLAKLHPTVTWIVRLHSELPFLAGEGMAMDWLADYMSIPNVVLGVNAPRMLREAQIYLSSKYGKNHIDGRIIYMPNFYPQEYKKNRLDKSKEYLDIGCFGAIRPLKNHMVQAVAAINFAESIGKKLRFHVNAGRIEMQGEPVLNNLRATFEQLYDKGHQLVNHQWTPREQFLDLCGQMDIGMQCSFSETFNIVGADFVSQGIPLVSSDEIPWACQFFNADPTDTNEILVALSRAYNYPKLNTYLNKLSLKHYTNQTRNIWLNYFKG